VPETFYRYRKWTIAYQDKEGLAKSLVTQYQKTLALQTTDLVDQLEELEAVKNERASECKRWQANFDYVRARLAAEIADYYEYNYMLGKMRKTFPPVHVDPRIHQGWQMVASDSCHDGTAELYAKRVGAYLDQLAKENLGTPWEFIARAERQHRLGLQWVPWLR
jgi:hypothetical protein